MQKNLSAIVSKCYESKLPIDDFIWFSMEANKETREALEGKLVSSKDVFDGNLPLPKTALSTYSTHVDGSISCQSGRFWRDDDGIMQIAVHINDNTTGKFVDVIVSPELNDDGDLEFSFSCESVISEEDLTNFGSMALGLFAEFQYWMQKATQPQSESLQAYTPKLTGTGRRQLAEGKSPLLSWKTVDVAPPSPCQDSQGGTHASPRLHSRRAHQRTLKSGTQIWVKSCNVGQAINGIGLHDYEIRTMPKKSLMPKSLIDNSAGISEDIHADDLSAQPREKNRG